MSGRQNRAQSLKLVRKIKEKPGTNSGLGRIYGLHRVGNCGKILCAGSVEKTKHLISDEKT